MTKIIRNSNVYMEQDGNKIWICQVTRSRNKLREIWSMMHVTPADIDVHVRMVEVPLKVRLAARAHFKQEKGE